MEEVYSHLLRKLWKEWIVRILVLLSLTFQILLVCFGSSRKYSRKLRIRIVVWFSYLFADSMATFGLGAISNALLDMYDNSKNLNPEVELSAFWAPFLLLHLGGPDTITAYALEDNELWLRHLLGLFFQAGGSVYVFLLAWTGSRLSVLTILMILVGLFKYGERIWVLWRASSAQLENFPSARGALFHDNVMSHIEVNGAPQESIIFVAYRLIPFCMPSIVRAGQGEVLSVDGSIQKAPASNISRLIEAELGFMYDLLYTKARAYTPCSLALRLIGFFLTCIVLVLFSIGVTQKNNYSKVDLAITFVLIVGAIIIDLYAAFALLSSNWATALLYGWSQKNSCYKAIVDCQKYLNRSPSWSNSISQFSMLRFSLGENHVRFGGILHKLFPSVHEKLKQQQSITYTQAGPLEQRIICKVQKKHKELGHQTQGFRLPFLLGHVDDALQKYNYIGGLNPYKGRDIMENIIVWHIATEILYYLDAKAAGNVLDLIQHSEISLHISQYMSSLLVIYPSMLSTHLNGGLFEHTCSYLDPNVNSTIWRYDYSILPPIRKSDDFRRLYEELRVTGHIRDPAFYFRERELMHAAISLSLILDREFSDMEMKWEMISDVWLEMLLYVASQWKGTEHAHQLRRGGELLTHVWLLMVHLDLA